MATDFYGYGLNSMVFQRGRCGLSKSIDSSVENNSFNEEPYYIEEPFLPESDKGNKEVSIVPERDKVDEEPTILTDSDKGKKEVSIVPDRDKVDEEQSILLESDKGKKEPTILTDSDKGNKEASILPDRDKVDEEPTSHYFENNDDYSENSDDYLEDGDEFFQKSDNENDYERERYRDYLYGNFPYNDEYYESNDESYENNDESYENNDESYENNNKFYKNNKEFYENNFYENNKEFYENKNNEESYDNNEESYENNDESSQNNEESYQNNSYENNDESYKSGYWDKNSYLEDKSGYWEEIDKSNEDTTSVNVNEIKKENKYESECSRESCGTVKKSSETNSTGKKSESNSTSDSGENNCTNSNYSDSDIPQIDDADETTNKYAHLWEQCDDCALLNYKKFFKTKLNICEHCGFHAKMSSSDRIDLLIDKDTWIPINEDLCSRDPVEFESEEGESYENRLDSYQKRTGLPEAVQTGTGQLNGIPVAMGVMDFDFMGGSMGLVVGELITRLIEYATLARLPLIIVCASGGARMQEGGVSLMQMGKIVTALYQYQIMTHLLYIPILTSPTTGGVTASFGMLGDIVISEPDAYIAFAGKRVIELALNQAVPEGSQTSEFLFDKGLFDSILPRTCLKTILSDILKLHAFRVLKLKINNYDSHN